MHPILAVDVGGTKTLLRLLDATGAVVATERLESAAHADLETPIAALLSRHPTLRPVACACGVAGPVVDDVCRTTNLPWVVDARALSARCGIPRVRVINDFEATAYGVLELAPSSLVTLQPGEPRRGAPIAVVGAGTGLGEALLLHVDGRAHVVPGEGGHADFAPRNELEVGLLRWLEARVGRVSWERVVSGMGIASIYAYLRDAKVAAERPDVAAELADADPGAVIGAHALAGDDALCVRTIDLFVSAYGAEAGNAALRVIAHGGVYLTGGIAPKLLPKLREGGFLRAFRDKGRLSHVCEKTPVHVVLDQEVALAGAARVARTLVDGASAT